MCVVVQTNALYKTREGYDAFVAAKNPWGTNQEHEKNAFVGFVKDFDGNISIVGWQSCGHIEDERTPHMNDLDEDIPPVVLAPQAA